MANFNGPTNYYDFRLDLGAYENVYRGEADFGGQDESLLTVSTDDGSYDAGQVWQGKFPNWVYESGVGPPTGVTSPISVSGIYVDGAYYPSSVSGQYAHHIDYINGRIIFDSAISSGVTLQVEHSYKLVYIGLSSEKNAKNLIQSAFQNPSASGWPDYPTLREIYMPAIFVETPTASSRGAQLGGGHIFTQNLYFHVFTDDDYDLSNLTSLLSYLQDSSIEGVDWNSAPFPLNEYGDRSSNYLPYDTLAQNYQWRLIRFMEAFVARPLIEDSFMWTTVTIDAEIWMLDI